MLKKMPTVSHTFYNLAGDKAVITRLSLLGYDRQRGAALIVVLLVLVLVMLVGIIAVRRSTSDLRLATSDQINTLLLQGSDGANAKLENVVNGPVTGSNYRDSLSDNGVFGHFFKPEARGDELIYCYNPRNQQVMTNGTRIVRNGGNLTGYTTGFCDPSQASSYISARNTVATQVSITLAATPTTQEAYTNVAQQRDVNIGGDNDGGVTNYLFNVRSTAAIPAYNDPKACFKEAGLINKPNLLKCLRDNQVPSKQIDSQMYLDYGENTTTCLNFGTGTGQLLDSKCTATR